MNEKGANLFIFSLGAAIGSIATWICVKEKYEKQAQEEIDSVKKVFAEKKASEKTLFDYEVGNTKSKLKEEYKEYQRIIDDLGYRRKSMKKGVEVGIKALIIKPEAFGLIADYDRIDLTYYADGVLADDADEVIEDWEEIVGSDLADHFGEFEEDTVYIRNDSLGTYYEITRDMRAYSDVVGIAQ